MRMAIVGVVVQDGAEQGYARRSAEEPAQVFVVGLRGRRAGDNAGQGKGQRQRCRGKQSGKGFEHDIFLRKERGQGQGRVDAGMSNFPPVSPGQAISGARYPITSRKKANDIA